LIRFFWNKPTSTPHNKASLVRVLNDVKAKGPHLGVAAMVHFTHITDDALMERIESKYTYMQKTMNKAKDLAALQGDIDEAAENGDEEKLQEYTILYAKRSADRATMNSRATGVSEIY
jgi:hypothetical protein